METPGRTDEAAPSAADDGSNDDEHLLGNLVQYRKWATGKGEIPSSTKYNWRKRKERDPAPDLADQVYAHAGEDDFELILNARHVNMMGVAVDVNMEDTLRPAGDVEDVESNTDPDSNNFDTDVSDFEPLVDNVVSHDIIEQGYLTGDAERESTVELNVLLEIKQRLYDGSEHSTEEAILMLMEIYKGNKGMTKQCLHDLASLIHVLLPQPNNFPGSKFQLLQSIGKLAPCYKPVKYAYCKKCEYYEGLHPEEKCTACNSMDSVDYFYMFPLEDAVRHLFEVRNLAKIIKKQNNNQDGSTSDITDGLIYKSFAGEMGPYDITLVWNSDGVSVSKSSKAQIWPIQCTICEVPPKLRRYYLMVIGIFYAGSKPNFNTFLRPFVSSLREIADKGGVQWRDPSSGEMKVSVVRAPVASLDAPARAQALNMTSHGGLYGCGMCENPGIRIPHGRGTTRVFPPEEVMTLRTAENMHLQSLRATRDNPIMGLFGPTLVRYIPHFNPARSVPNEYFHGSVAGVNRQFTVTWITDHRGDWYIAQHINTIDNFLRKIAPPDTISRTPRSLREWKLWKGSEWRSWLLFYSIPALQNILPDKYFQHWLLFVKVMYLLLQEKIQHNELQLTRSLLKLFIADISNLYSYNPNPREQPNLPRAEWTNGNFMYSFNLHQLTHLPTVVEDTGPLWATSAFPFEDSNGDLKRKIHGTNSIDIELVTNLQILESVRVLRNKVRMEKCFSDSASVVDVYGNVANVNCSQEELTLLSDVVDHTLTMDCFFARGILRSEIFTSTSYDRESKRNSFTVRCELNGRIKYGEIKYYVKTQDKVVYCMLNLLQIDHANMIVHVETGTILKHILPINLDFREMVVIKLEQVRYKVIRVGNYICLPPNHLEQNL